MTPPRGVTKQTSGGDKKRVYKGERRLVGMTTMSGDQLDRKKSISINTRFTKLMADRLDKAIKRWEDGKLEYIDLSDEDESK